MSEASRTNRERWQRVEQIYAEAGERQGDARRALLEHACGCDVELRRDVESLLACEVDAARFIETPALDVAVALLTDASHAELVGQTIGPYVIEAWLGSGGMGDVYRARDRQLHRAVALKVLPDVFAVDPDRLERFTREAQVLAALNHPNIASIYGFEKSDGVQALVLEFVDGPTLADRIARGPIPIDEARPLARQIAEGLEAAHEQGIVHRDLKPANIAVRPDGTVKILDFGLAEVLQPATAAGPHGPDEPLTNASSPAPAAVVLGTAPYMSPEQAKGRPADKRSDIWAFGAVLYEMLSGRRAFRGDGTAEVLAAIAAQELDWHALPRSTPAEMRRLLSRCLEPDVKRRLRDIGEARILLDNETVPSAIVGDIRGAHASSRARSRRAIAVLLAFVTGALAAVAAWQLKPVEPRSVARFGFSLPEGLRFSREGRHSMAISRDGTQLAFFAVPTGLYLRAMSQLDATRIQGTEGFARITEPAFSPDGRSIVFYADRALRTISVTGGEAVTVAPSDPPYGIHWGNDGIVFGQGSKGILRVAHTGGTPEILVRVNDDEEAHGPQILPGGQHVLFTLATGTARDRWNRARIVVQSLASGVRTTLIDGGSDARYLPTGHLVYGMSGVLYAVPFDTARPALTGAAVPIVEGVSRAFGSQTGAAHYSVSETGTLVYIPGPVDASAGLGEVTQLAMVDRKGVIDRLPLPPDTYQTPRVSPDGSRIAFGTDDGREAIVWIYDLFGNTPRRRLTFGGNNRFPVWSADGKRIVFQSDRDGDAGIFSQASDGSGTAQRLTKPQDDTSHVPESWSPHGDRLLFSVESLGKAALWIASVRDGTAAPFGDVHSVTPIAATFSPDGRWVAYASSDGRKQTIYVQPFPPTGAKYQLVASGLDLPSHPVWSPDGNELFYNPRPRGFDAVRVSTTPTFVFGDAVPVPRSFQLSPPERRRAYDITPAGKFVARVAPTDEASGEGVQPIQVVINWFEELRARVRVSR